MVLICLTTSQMLRSHVCACSHIAVGMSAPCSTSREQSHTPDDDSITSVACQMPVCVPVCRHAIISFDGVQATASSFAAKKAHQYLVDGGYIDRQTRRLTVDVLAFHAQTRMFVTLALSLVRCKLDHRCLCKLSSLVTTVLYVCRTARTLSFAVA